MSNPLVAAEMLPKEPDEVARFHFDLECSRMLADGEAVSAVVVGSPTVTPAEEDHDVPIGAITDGPFLAGEEVTTDGGLKLVARERTATGASALKVISSGTVPDGAVLTGTSSCATATASAASTKTADGLTVDSTSVKPAAVDVVLSAGLRPPDGVTEREYVVSLRVTTSNSQTLYLAGRVRIPAAAKAGNVR